MIICIRCLSCGHVLADKWGYYERECKKLEDKMKEEDEGKTDEERANSSTLKNMDHCLRGKVLDDLGLNRSCCRRMLLGTVSLIELI